MYENHENHEGEEVFTCWACGAVTPRSESAGTDSSDHEICEGCREYHELCDDCGDWTDTSELCETVHNDYICRSCANIHYYECDECGRYVHEDYAFHHRDMNYCENCYDNIAKPIQDYHSCDVSYPKYGKTDENLFFGIELEVDGGGCDDYIAEHVLDLMEGHCVCQEDGSLSEGFEIITYPHTYEEMRLLPWAEVCSYLERKGYDNWNGDAGMHIHFSRAYFDNDWETITRYAFFFERFKKFTESYSRRDYDSLVHWSGFATDPDVPCVKKEETKAHMSRRGRYTITNTTNCCTIECRMFNSTTDPDLILANLELVKLVAEKAKAWTDEEAESASFWDWLEGASPDLVHYVNEVYDPCCQDILKGAVA